MLSRLWLCLRALWAFVRVGLVPLWPVTLVRIALAYRRCRGSLAFLGEVAALRAGTRLALLDDDGPLTFGELHTQVQTLAATLIRRFDLGPGCRVALLGRNHRSLVAGLFAVSRTGADVVLLNPDSPPNALCAQLRAIADEGRLLLGHTSDVDATAFAPDHPCIALDAAFDAQTSAPLPTLHRPGQVCILTAGSTGMPKRITRRPSVAALSPIVLGLLDSLPIALHRPVALAVPIFHGHGLSALAAAMAFLAPVHLGRRLAIAPLLEHGKDPVVVISVPTLLKRWLATGPGTIPVAAILTGSAPLDADLCRALITAMGPVLYNLYGSSEAGLVSIATPTMLTAAPGTVGRPLPGTCVRILDGDRPENTGHVGRIQVRGPLAQATTDDGWLDTHDRGRLDDQGLLHVCGRADDMFVSGGENVYPQVVESCLAAHPRIAEAAIVVVPDPEFGARMRAFVVPRDGDLTRDEIKNWLRERLDRHQLPRSIEFLAELPRNALGKLDRPSLRSLPEGGKKPVSSE